MKMQILKWVTAFVLAALIFVGLAFVVTWENDSTEWYASPHERRVWAEEKYLEVVDPQPTAADPQDAVYRIGVGATKLDDSDPKRSEIKMEIHPAEEEFVPKREVVQFNTRDEFSVGGVRGHVRLVATIDPSKKVVKGEPPSILFFNGELEEMTDKEKLAEFGAEKWRFSMGDHDQRAYRLVIRFELEESENARWNAVEVFNAETGCDISNSNIWVNKGSVSWFSTNLCVLHDPAVEVVMDVAHGTPVRSESPLKMGEVFNDGEVSVEIAGIFKGHATTFGDYVDCQGVHWKTIGGDSTARACSIGYVVNPPAFAGSIEIDALDMDGNEIPNGGGGSSGNGFQSVSYEVKSDEIDRLVISRRPKMTRLIAELDHLPAVRSVNVDPADLFDVVMPLEMIEKSVDPFEPTPLDRISDVLEFEYARKMSINWPNPASGQTVRDYLVAVGKRNPRISIEVDSSGHRFSVVNKTSPMERAWNKMKVWIKL